VTLSYLCLAPGGAGYAVAAVVMSAKVWPKRRSDIPIWSRCFVIPPRKKGQPAPRRSAVSTSAASGTTRASSRRWISSATAAGSIFEDDRIAARRNGFERRGERETIRESVVHSLQDVIRDARPDHLQEDRRRHRHAERHDGLVDLLDRRAMLDRIHDRACHPRQHSIDDEPRVVAHKDRALAELLSDRPQGCQRLFRRLVAAHHLQQRHYGDRIEEMHSRNALGPVEPGRHVRDGQRGGIRGDDAVIRHDRRELRQDLLLHVEILEDRLEHEVAVREAVVAGFAGDERSKKAGFWLVAPLAGFGGDVLDRLVDDLLLHVADDDGQLEAAHEEHRDLPCHQAGAHNPDLSHVTRRSRRLARVSLRALLDELEGVDGRLRLWPGK
jgi:hypothetical protein